MPFGSVAFTWGTSADERALEYACDRYVESGVGYNRGVTVEAPPGVVFRWLCQLRVAPYSYDWVDNLGRKSPQQLTPGLDELAPGQRVMRALDLVEFERDHHITAVTSSRLFGQIGATYLVVPRAVSCRLLMKIAVRYPRTPLGWMMRLLLPWGDLVMARRQMLNLKALAERTAKSRPAG